MTTTAKPDRVLTVRFIDTANDRLIEIRTAAAVIAAAFDGLDDELDEDVLSDFKAGGKDLAEKIRESAIALKEALDDAWKGEAR